MTYILAALTAADDLISDRHARRFLDDLGEVAKAQGVDPSVLWAALTVGAET